METELRKKIINGEIDINNQSLYFYALVKGFLIQMYNQVSIRGIKVPHMILNTGDDILYLENKGQDYSLEPAEVSNESYVYNQVPRCIVDVKGFGTLPDQLTSPYTRGNFQIEYDDRLVGLTAEFRRMPIKSGVSLRYITGSFHDQIELSQHLLSKMSFVRTYTYQYMGQTLTASYRMPDEYNGEFNVTFDATSTDAKYNTVSCDIEIESYFPVYAPKTVIESDAYIKYMSNKIATTENPDGTKTTFQSELILPAGEKVPYVFGNDKS